MNKIEEPESGVSAVEVATHDALLIAFKDHFLYQAIVNFDDLNEITSRLPRQFLPIGEAFSENLMAAYNTINMPYQMMFGNALMDVRHESEQQGATSDNFVSYVMANPLVLYNATQKGQIRCEILRDLPQIRIASDELLRQGVILFWSSFEIFTRDLFIALLNTWPEMTKLLLADSSRTKKFKDAKLADIVAEHGFDLSEHMGTVFDGLYQLDSLNGIKSTFATLFPASTELREALSADSLRVLYERRNLIAHRRGVIDQSYQARVPADGVVGSRVNVSPQDLTQYFIDLERAGYALLHIVSERITL